MDITIIGKWSSPSPYAAVGDVLETYEGQLDGKVIVDITNPIDFSTFSPITFDAGSAAQEIAGRASGAKVVKAFNMTSVPRGRPTAHGGRPLVGQSRSPASLSPPWSLSPALLITWKLLSRWTSTWLPSARVTSTS
jgi:hypothetical protein